MQKSTHEMDVERVGAFLKGFLTVGLFAGLAAVWAGLWTIGMHMDPLIAIKPTVLGMVAVATWVVLPGYKGGTPGPQVVLALSAAWPAICFLVDLVYG